MRITKNQLKRIIREEAAKLAKEKLINEQAPGEEPDAASKSDLKNWFMEKVKTINNLDVPSTQIGPLIAAMDDAIEVAQAGKLKAKSGYLGGVMDKLSGQDQ